VLEQPADVGLRWITWQQRRDQLILQTQAGLAEGGRCRACLDLKRFGCSSFEVMAVG
jgi:hypothetical protein